MSLRLHHKPAGRACSALEGQEKLLPLTLSLWKSGRRARGHTEPLQTPTDRRTSREPTKGLRVLAALGATLPGPYSECTDSLLLKHMTHLTRHTFRWQKGVRLGYPLPSWPVLCCTHRQRQTSIRAMLGSNLISCIVSPDTTRSHALAALLVGK
jgi:hypothetical protein